jgi:hypothetical protein
MQYPLVPSLISICILNCLALRLHDDGSCLLSNCDLFAKTPRLPWLKPHPIDRLCICHVLIPNIWVGSQKPVLHYALVPFLQNHISFHLIYIFRYALYMENNMWYKVRQSRQDRRDIYYFVYRFEYWFWISFNFPYVACPMISH